MDNKETTQAANALVQWFNSQEIQREDALVIMNKVVAKILVGAVRGAHSRDQRAAINEGVDLYTLALVHEINERLFRTQRPSGR